MLHEIITHLNNIFQSMGVLGLVINAAIESCLPGFPLPPDILLSVMNLAKPDKAMFYATVCTLGSVFGGTIGFCFGRFGGRPVCDFIFKNNPEKLQTVENMYKKYGSFAVFVSAFTPIPYNIFTIASGILKMNFIKFFFASVLGRGGRFFLVSVVLMFFGETVKKYLDIVILLLTLLVIIFFIIVYKKRHTLTSNNFIQQETEVTDEHN